MPRRDITDIKRARVAPRRHRGRLHEKMRARTARAIVLGNCAHDISRMAHPLFTRSAPRRARWPACLSSFTSNAGASFDEERPPDGDGGPHPARSTRVPPDAIGSEVCVATRESLRLREDRDQGKHWKRWGPYLSERQWGTVREDYSTTGDVWNYFTHDQARSRTYRWGEDGLAGFSDDRQQLVLLAGPLERGRSDSEGTAVRPHQQRRQSWRRRQGVLLLSRRHAVAFLFEVSL